MGCDPNVRMADREKSFGVPSVGPKLVQEANAKSLQTSVIDCMVVE